MSEKTNNIGSFSDLEEYGLNCLTGEACAFHMRLLFDYNAEGAELLTNFLGLPVLADNSNWNSRVDGEDAVGSIMLTADAAWELATFAMLQYGFDRVIPNQPEHHGCYGYDLGNQIADEYETGIGDKYRI